MVIDSHPYGQVWLSLMARDANPDKGGDGVPG